MLNNLEEQFKKGENFIGTAFITFETQLPVKILLSNYGVTFYRNF